MSSNTDAIEKFVPQKMEMVKPSLTMDIPTIGKIFAQSGFFQDAADAAKAIVKIMAGAELGLPPIASMTGVHIIKGKVSLSANLIAAAIKRSGKYTYAIKRLDTEGCILEFFEGGKSIGESAFTKDDAQKANVLSNPNYQKFARNMYFARALSNGAKWYCPDIFGGPIYTPDELGADIDESGNITEKAVRSNAESVPIHQEQAEKTEPQPHRTEAAVASQPATPQPAPEPAPATPAPVQAAAPEWAVKQTPVPQNEEPTQPVQPAAVPVGKIIKGVPFPAVYTRNADETDAPTQEQLLRAETVLQAVREKTGKPNLTLNSIVRQWCQVEMERVNGATVESVIKVLENWK